MTLCYNTNMIARLSYAALVGIITYILLTTIVLILRKILPDAATAIDGWVPFLSFLTAVVYFFYHPDSYLR